MGMRRLHELMITTPEYDVSDFLKAVNFITPPNTKLSYFIIPYAAGVQGFELPAGAPFSREADVPEDESIVYRRTEPIMKQDIAESPAEYSFWNPDKLGRKQPTTRPLPSVTQPGEMGSPFVKILSENRVAPEDVVLRETWECFPKGTIFHFKERRVREASLKEPSFFKKMLFTPAPPVNDDSLNTIGLSPEVDSFIDESLAEGLRPREIARKILGNKYYAKHFKKNAYHYKPEDVEKELSMYIFRRSQGFKVRGGGEEGQQLLFKD
jgi:hypothetical protein